MKKIVVFGVLLLAGCSQGQDEVMPPGARPNVVAVGKGSYASFPPPEADKVARPTITRRLQLLPEAEGRPVPTNQWWTNLLVNRFTGQLHVAPHQVRTGRDGIELFLPTRWNDSGSDPIAENPLRIGGVDFTAEETRAKTWSDWLLTFRLSQSENEYIDVTLGRGLPYVWLEPNGVNLQFTLQRGVAFFTDAGEPQALPAGGATLGITAGGRSYGLFVPAGSGFAREGDRLNLTLGGKKPFAVVCPLGQPSDIKLFRRFADAIPRDSRLSWNYDPARGEVVTQWHLETELLQGTEKRLLQGWLPHHYRKTHQALQFVGPEYLTVRGTLKLAAGTDFSIAYPFNGLPFALPAPQATGLANDFDAARLADYVARYATRTDYGEDTYWGGKHLLQWGQYLWIARATGDPNAEKLRASLRRALADWLTYTPGEKSRYFARYPRWQALVGFNASYGSENFNDQHFHYGYFTAAGALLGFDDPAFLQDYGGMLRLMAKEYANWERGDKNFPFLRTFDVWEGHSWAGGFSSPTGNNQESSSEAVQSWAGLFWLGQALGDADMAATGAMGYAMETRAAQEYWFDQRGGNFSPNWKHDVNGMVWGGGNNYGTYFSGDPAWIWGIQWLPMTPAMGYLMEDPAFAKKSFRQMWAARRAKEGDFDINKLGAALGNVVLGQAAQVNPDWTAAQMDDLWAANSPVARDNDTPGLTYYLAHVNRFLGDIAWQRRLDWPLSRVYYQPRTGDYTVVAYNPAATPHTARLLENGKEIVRVALPPRKLAAVKVK